MSNDNIYAIPRESVGPFKFNDEVVAVFPDMINRSVPGYGLSLSLISLIAARYVTPGSKIYDLGCSLGAGILALQTANLPGDCQIIGVDNSEAMIKHCQTIIEAKNGSTPVELILGNLAEVKIENSSMVILNYTLQFIDQTRRSEIIQTIFDGLLPGGVLFLSEKVIFSDTDKKSRFIDIHHDFKRSQGYSDLEISQKRDSLENVLVPETISEHQGRLLGAGFRTAEVCLQALNFASLLAIK